jgi:hypothetical protein
MFRFAAATALVLISLSSPASGDPEQKGREKSKLPRTAGEIRKILGSAVTLPRGIEANTPLREAMEFLADTYSLPILINSVAFKEDAQIESVQDQPVRLELPIRGIKLSAILRALLTQVNGDYLVRGDHIEVTTLLRTRPSAWQERRQCAPVIDAEFSNRPLSAALQELSDESGISIVLDARMEETAKTSVTATLSGVPVDTAVELLANMVGLKMVIRDRALYVTEPGNAQQMEGEVKAVQAAAAAP